MKKKTKAGSQPPSLRERAESFPGGAATDAGAMDAEDMRRLVHELRVHQIELEMQNEELRHALLELAASHGRFADLYDFSPVGYLTLDAGGRILEANLKAAALLGVERAKLAGVEFTRFVARESQDVFYLHQSADYGLDQKRSCELFLHRSDGTSFPVLLESIRVEAPLHGKPVFRTAFINITERKAAEPALIESEALYRAVVETSPDGFWMLDEQGKILFVNNAYAARSGYRREELLTMALPELDAQETPTDVHRHMEKVRRQGTDLFESRHRAKSGEIWPVEVSGAYWSDSGRDSFFFAFLRDLTQRKRSEEALRNSEARFRATFEQAAVGMAHVSPAGQWLRVNRKLCEILGLAEEELLSMKFQDITHPEDFQASLSLFDRLLDGGLQTGSLEKRYLRKDGGVLWANLTVSLARKPDGSPEYFIAVTEDITGRKELERQGQIQREQMAALLQQQVAFQTAAAFAHELNQPLGAISAYSEVALRILQGEKAKPAVLKRVIEGCHGQAKRAGEVLHNLVGQMQGRQVEAGTFNLNEAIKEVVEGVRRNESHKFKAVCQLEPGLPPVSGNPLQTKHVLANLLRNAIDAMRNAQVAPDKSTITVRSWGEKEMAHVTVRDNGPGLDAAAAKRLFDPFFTTKQDGMGLGLAISRSLMDLQGGRLWAEPEEEGASFHFTLGFADE